MRRLNRFGPRGLRHAAESDDIMRRKQATALIDDIRVVVAEGLESRDKALALHIIEQKLRNFGLQDRKSVV